MKWWAEMELSCGEQVGFTERLRGQCNRCVVQTYSYIEMLNSAVPSMWLLDIMEEFQSGCRVFQKHCEEVEAWLFPGPPLLTVAMPAGAGEPLTLLPRYTFP